MMVHMGKGINAAGHSAHAQVLDDLKDQLLIVFLKRIQRAGLSLDFAVGEVDDTSSDLLAFSVRDEGPGGPVFHFELRRKS